MIRIDLQKDQDQNRKNCLKAIAITEVRDDNLDHNSYSEDIENLSHLF